MEKQTESRLQPILDKLKQDKLTKLEQAWANFFSPDIMGFPLNALNIKTMWWGAEKIIRSVFQNRRTAVKSGHSMSKDWSAGIVTLMWMTRFIPSKVILTAPTGRQVDHIMFGEIEKQFKILQKATPFVLSSDCLKTCMLEFDSDWFALGFTTKDTKDKTGKFQGFKSPNILIIVSEAQAVEDSVYDQIDGLMTSGNSRILEIGNPIVPEGRFWEHCTQEKYRYNVIKLSCLESPNYVAKKEVIPGMATYEFVEDMRRVWGEQHPYWYGKILGEFPQNVSDAIIPIAWIMRAVNREIPDNDDLRVGGLDVSKGGTDETVHAILHGRVCQPMIGFHNVDINETVGWAKSLVKEEKLEAYGVDEGGLAGIAGFLEEDDIPVVRIMFGSSVEGSDDFDNLAAYMWWLLRDAFQNNLISIPDDHVLVSQLSKRRFDRTSRGLRKIKIESKKQAKAERGEQSPDRADALAMAWYTRMCILNDKLDVSGYREHVSDASVVNEQIASASSGNRSKTRQLTPFDDSEESSVNRGDEVEAEGIRY